MNTIVSASRAMPWKPWFRWSLSFVGFPLAGVVARAVAGPIDTPLSAAAGGLAAGAVLGAVQAAARASSLGRRLAWAAATSLGMAGGLVLGAGAVDYRTSPSSLVAMGVLTGAVVGVAQASAADLTARRRVAWAVATPLLWGLGWLITSQVIVDGDRQHAMFGSSGAIVVALLSGLIVSQVTQKDPTPPFGGLKRGRASATVNARSFT